ncbi:hypothetical protein QI225_03340 [Staphylococcus saprophyticus]|nr:hypothetical protein [Staphylococcus saprophyticus]MDW4184301.1 hypothetical protein [Staphylococcus saprophyticus]MDW4352531.1 hypothetical protein [Staphylococcus saprophyticus]MDW4460796.1 hypothetical protein [Staphylococcus saprophyticus]MDW4468300.1 hypothetical protein [Staphylococcus saprophyticus]
MSTLKEICKEQTEMIDEMRQNIKELTEENEKLSEQYNKMIAERNSLIDDLSWYKAKVSRLERENEKKNMDADRLGYRWRNSHDEAKTYKSLLSEFSQHIGNKPSSSTYKYFRAKLDNLNITEDK